MSDSSILKRQSNQKKNQLKSKRASSPSQQHLSQKLSPHGLPILHYGGKNNIVYFTEKLKSRARQEYGFLARMLTTGEYYIPMRPECPFLDAIADEEDRADARTELQELARRLQGAH